MHLVYDRKPRIVPKITEQNVIVHIGKSEADVTNRPNKRLRLRYDTAEANCRQTKCHTTSVRQSELLVYFYWHIFSDTVIAVLSYELSWFF